MIRASELRQYAEVLEREAADRLQRYRAGDPAPVPPVLGERAATAKVIDAHDEHVGPAGFERARRQRERGVWIGARAEQFAVQPHLSMAADPFEVHRPGAPPEHRRALEPDLVPPDGAAVRPGRYVRVEVVGNRDRAPLREALPPPLAHANVPRIGRVAPPRVEGHRPRRAVGPGRPRIGAAAETRAATAAGGAGGALHGHRARLRRCLIGPGAHANGGFPHRGQQHET